MSCWVWSEIYWRRVSRASCGCLRTSVDWLAATLFSKCDLGQNLVDNTCTNTWQSKRSSPQESLLKHVIHAYVKYICMVAVTVPTWVLGPPAFQCQSDGRSANTLHRLAQADAVHQPARQTASLLTRQPRYCRRYRGNFYVRDVSRIWFTDLVLYMVGSGSGFADFVLYMIKSVNAFADLKINFGNPLKKKPFPLKNGGYPWMHLQICFFDFQICKPIPGFRPARSKSGNALAHVVLHIDTCRMHVHVVLWSMRAFALLLDISSLQLHSYLGSPSAKCPQYKKCSKYKDLAPFWGAADMRATFPSICSTNMQSFQRCQR